MKSLLAALALLALVPAFADVIALAPQGAPALSEQPR